MAVTVVGHGRVFPVRVIPAVGAAAPFRTDIGMIRVDTGIHGRDHDASTVIARGPEFRRPDGIDIPLRYR